MSVSIAPASSSKTRSISYPAVKSDNNRPDDATISPIVQSVDPRTSKTLPPQQGDALLSLSSVGTTDRSSTAQTGGHSNVSSANQSYHDAEVRPASYNEDEDPWWQHIFLPPDPGNIPPQSPPAPAPGPYDFPSPGFNPGQPQQKDPGYVPPEVAPGKA